MMTNLLAFSHNGDLLAHFSNKLEVLSIHYLGSGAHRAAPSIKTRNICAMDFHPMDSKLAVITSDNQNLSRGLVMYSFPSESRLLTPETVELGLNETMKPQLIKHSKDSKYLMLYAKVLIPSKELPTEPGQNKERGTWIDRLIVLNSSTHKVLASIDIEVSINCIDSTFKQGCFILGAQDGRLRIYQVTKKEDNGAESYSIDLKESLALSMSPISTISYASSDDVIMVGTRDGNALLLDAKYLICLKTLAPDINAPISRISISSSSKHKIAVISYIKSAAQPAQLVLIDNNESDELFSEWRSHMLKKFSNGKYLDRALKEYQEEHGSWSQGTVIGELSLKLLDAASTQSSPNNSNITGDGVHFQPGTGSLGMISFINLEGKVAIRSVADVITDHWKSVLQTKIDEWLKSEKKSEKSADNGRKKHSDNRPNKNPKHHASRKEYRQQNSGSSQQQQQSQVKQQRSQYPSKSSYQQREKRDRDRAFDYDRDYDYDRRDDRKKRDNKRSSNTTYPSDGNRR